jgi:putative flavoprotein involved in K+ transport
VGCRKQALDAIIIGAGPSGLAAAAMVGRSGLRAKVLERGAHLGMSWRFQYAGLRLNTLRWLSAAPGVRLARRYGRWVASTDYVHYLERYASHHAIDIVLNTQAVKLERHDGLWHALSPDGVHVAFNVVVATGWCNAPFIPDWPGRAGFEGTLTHASEYRDPSAFMGRNVLIAGCGNTGTELAEQLSSGGAKTVWISVRTPPNLVPKEFLGLPLHPVSILARPFPPALLDVPTRIMQRYVFDDLTPYGLPRAPMGVHAANRRGMYPVIDSGFSRAVRSRRVLPVASVVGFDKDAVLLGDGARVRADDVVAATGYTRNLDDLVGHLDVLDANGAPIPETSGLHFVGFTPRLGGLLFDIGIESRRVARAIARRRRCLADSDCR